MLLFAFSVSLRLGADLTHSASLRSRSSAETADCLPFPYSPVKLPAKLKFGYYTTNGLVKPVAPVVRGIEEAVAALKKAGHEVVEFVPPQTKELMQYALFDFGAYMAQFLDLAKAGGDELEIGRAHV